MVRMVLPQAKVLQLDTQANVIQALDSGRADTAAVDLSTVRWLVKRNPNAYVMPVQLVFHAVRRRMRQGDLDWLNFVNTTFNVAMFGHQNDIYDKAFEDFFGLKPPVRKPGLPAF